jgi:hypothetical protein
LQEGKLFARKVLLLQIAGVDEGWERLGAVTVGQLGGARTEEKAADVVGLRRSAEEHGSMHTLGKSK